MRGRVSAETCPEFFQLRVVFQPALIFLDITTVEIVIAKKIHPDEQNSRAFPVGVGDGTGVALGWVVNEAVGMELLVLVLTCVTVGTTGSMPVTETKLSRTRACAEVVSSPKKRKFGVS